MNVLITGAGLRNHFFQIEAGSEYFPEDAWGGRKNIAQPIRLLFDGTSEVVNTDISAKRAPRNARGEIRRFFKFHNAKEGETLVIEKTAEREYRVRMARSTSIQTIDPDRALATAPQGTELPQRSSTLIERVIRETKVTLYVKKLYDFKCQICGTALPTLSGPYAEGAHIRPLGTPHNGPDVIENVLCLCPNHHVMLDGGSLSIREDYSLVGSSGRLVVHERHNIDLRHLNYHLSRIARP